MGKMGTENGARGGRTKVVGWFMVLDLGGLVVVRESVARKLRRLVE